MGARIPQAFDRSGAYADRRHGPPSPCADPPPARQSVSRPVTTGVTNTRRTLRPSAIRTLSVLKSLAGQALRFCPSPGGQGVAGSNPVIPTRFA